MRKHPVMTYALAGVLAVASLAGFGYHGQRITTAFAAESAEKGYENPDAAKVAALRTDPAALRKLVAFAVNGDETKMTDVDEFLKRTKIEDVVIAGIPYTLVSIPGYEEPDWAVANLPEALAKPAETRPSDEQVLTYLQKLTESARASFEKKASEDYEKNASIHRKRFPAQWTDEQVKATVIRNYEVGANDKAVPDVQKLYNEYLALDQLTGIFTFYLKYKQKL